MKNQAQPINSDPDHHESPLNSFSFPSKNSRILRIAIRILVIFFLQVGLTFLTLAQHKPYSTENRILLRQAMLDIDRLEYDKAITKLLDVRTTGGANPNVCYLLGKSYLYSTRTRSLEKAVFYLQKASHSPSENYQEWDLDELNAPMEVFYHLGKAQEKIGLYEFAADSYASCLLNLAIDKNIQRSKMYRIIEQAALNCLLTANPPIETEEAIAVQSK